MRLLALLLICLVSSSAVVCAVEAQEDSINLIDAEVNFHLSNSSKVEYGRHLSSLVGDLQIVAGPTYVSCQSSIVNSFSGTALPLVWTCSDSGYGDNEDSTIRLSGPGASTRTETSLTQRKVRLLTFPFLPSRQAHIYEVWHGGKARLHPIWDNNRLQILRILVILRTH